MLTFDEARKIVIGKVTQIVRFSPPRQEPVPLGDSLGRVLAQEVRADRPYPPFDRSLRDGFAVRASEVFLGAKLRLIGELKAGDTPQLSVCPGTCVQIMTGAAVPSGADAVV